MIGTANSFTGIATVIEKLHVTQTGSLNTSLILLYDILKKNTNRKFKKFNFILSNLYSKTPLTDKPTGAGSYKIMHNSESGIGNVQHRLSSPFNPVRRIKPAKISAKKAPRKAVIN